MISPIWIIGFSGHRPSSVPGRSREEIAGCRDAIRLALIDLQSRASQAGGSIELYTSLAAGADIEAAEAAEELGIPIHIILPIPIEMFEDDFKGDTGGDWSRALRHIERSKDPQHPGSFRIAIGDNIRPDCYHEANLQLVQCIDGLIVLWNGEHSQSIGGTSELVDEADRLVIPKIIIDPASPGLTDQEPGSEARLCDEQLSEFKEWPCCEETINELNEWTKSVATSAGNEAGTRRGEGEAWDCFARLNAVADRDGRFFKSSLLWSIRLHFLAATLAAATAAFASVLHYRADNVYGGHTKDAAHTMHAVPLDEPNKPTSHEFGMAGLLHAAPKALTALEFALVFAAFVLMAFVGNLRTHYKWRQCRFAAELTHSMIMSARHIDPISSRIARQHKSWRHFAISVALLAYRSSTVLDNFDAEKRNYLKGRIEDQIAYFKREIDRTSVWNYTYKQIGFFASGLAWVFIGLALTLKFVAPEWVSTEYPGALLAIFMPVFLPLLAGASTSLMIGSDVSRRAERYENMVDRLSRIAELLPGVKTPGALRRMVEETEELLLDEQLEWYAVAKEVSH